jgi:hypothetical protein
MNRSIITLTFAFLVLSPRAEAQTFGFDFVLDHGTELVGAPGSMIQVTGHAAISVSVPGVGARCWWMDVRC